MGATNLFLLGSAVILVGVERIPAARRLRLRMLRPFFGADFMLLAAGFAMSALATSYIAWGSQSFGRLGVPRLTSMGMPLWATSLGALVLLDLGNYAAHLTLHRIDVLWEFHKVHHSSKVLDWLATFRFHVVELVLRRLVAVMLLIAVGVPPDAVAVAAAALQAWGMLNHSNLAVGLRFLEPVFITPRLHHLHHMPDNSGRNLGTVFSLWDRLLGRLALDEVPAAAELGPPGETSSYPQGFVNQLAEPFRRLRQPFARNVARNPGRPVLPA